MRKSVIAAMLGAALVLGGCTAQTGAAAVVDGQAISTATLDRTTRELGELFTVDARGVLTMLIISPSYLAEASANGVAKSRDEARAYLAGLVSSDLGSDTDVSSFSDATLDLVRFDMAVRALSQLPEAQEIGARVQEHLAGLDVEVNPRFGEFSAQTTAIAPVIPDWLVQPATA